MALTDLPEEMIEHIVPFTMPEGFTSFALTCKRIYRICHPSIANHKGMQQQFNHFDYDIANHSTAFSLLNQIAREPVVSRYIMDANFESDSHTIGSTPQQHSFNTVRDSPVVRLLAESAYLKKAGLDWQEYSAEMEKELLEGGYSQYAAAFLITLLPNLRTMRLPKRWKLLDTTDKLISVVIREAHQPHLPHNRPSLAEFTYLRSHSVTPGRQASRYRSNLESLKPFLALPRIQTLLACDYVSFRGDGLENIAANCLDNGSSQSLVHLHLRHCCIDEAKIAALLQHTRNIRSFGYSHNTPAEFRPRHWDIYALISTIRNSVGNQLKDLRLVIDQPYDSLSPGRASLHGFPQLNRLTLPLKLVLCNLNAAKQDMLVTTKPQDPSDNNSNGIAKIQLSRKQEELSIRDLLPASVTRFSLRSTGTYDEMMAFRVVLRYITKQKEANLPYPHEVSFSYPLHAYDALGRHRDHIHFQCWKIGVTLREKVF